MRLLSVLRYRCPSPVLNENAVYAIGNGTDALIIGSDIVSAENVSCCGNAGEI